MVSETSLRRLAEKSRPFLRWAPVVFLLGALAAAQEAPPVQPPLWNSKPDATAFEKIENERLDAARHSIDEITAVKGARSIENTLAPYDDALQQIDSASYFADLMQQVHPDPDFRDRAGEMLRKASALSTALALNRDVYDALASLDVSRADAATRYYVQRQLLEFRLAGVNKDEATRSQLKKLNDQLVEEQSMFDRNISDGQNVVEVTDPADLDGLPQDYIDGHKPGVDGKIRLTTAYPDVFPVLKFAKSDKLRRRMWLAFRTRAYPKNRDVLEAMMRTRYQIASLLGYTSWADYNASDKMIGNAENIGDFIDKVDAAARPLVLHEFQLLLAEKQKADPHATQVGNYEVAYLSGLVERSQYDFDSQSVRPYLPYAAVQQGVLDTAAKLFHLTFRQEQSAPAWDPSVETWDVFDTGKMIGRFYLDMHPRAGKYSHEEMAPVLDGVRGKQLPEAILVCNFPAPTATDPALMEFSDVVTFFHEFGHLMHWILGGQQQWAGISGITMEGDFTEAPSQMLEEWMHSPQVLDSFARDYKTGKPIPADLVARMNRADAFGRGAWVADQTADTAISYDLYKGKPEDVDPDEVCDKDEERYTPFAALPGTHMYASFTHLGGYSSAYYTYLWDKVIAEDFFLQFDQKDLMAGPTPMRYRREVLEPGGSMSANDLVKNFLGRPQNMAAFQKWMGQEFASPEAPKAGQ